MIGHGLTLPGSRGAILWVHSLPIGRYHESIAAGEVSRAMVGISPRDVSMAMISPIPEAWRLLLEALFWLTLTLNTLALLNRLHHHLSGVILADRFARECRRRGLIAGTPMPR